MPVPPRLVRTLVISAFLLRGAFYCAALPVWEGFDEWAHFGYIQHLAQFGRPPSRIEPVSDMLRRSVELAPISANAASYSRASLTHDAYWQLSPQERLARQRELAELRQSYANASDSNSSGGNPALRQYEAQQPPLYYLLLTPVDLAFRNASIPAQVFALRLAGLLFAVVGMSLCYELPLQIPASRRAAMPLLVLMAAWPGLMVNVSRIANDSLAMALGSAFLLSLFRIVRGDGRLRRWVLAAVLLGAALLTKSYMLALVPLLPATALIEWRTSRRRRSAWRGLLVALVIAGLTAGWWYVANVRATGTLSGEQIDAAAARFGFAGKIAALGKIQWLRVLDSTASTYIWAGGWSFLTARTWMVRVFECLAAVAAVGLVLLAVRSFKKVHRRGLKDANACLLLAACACLLFCLALAYFAVVVYLTQGASTALGWYLYAVTGAAAVLLAAGFAGLVGARGAAASVAVIATLACAFDLYTVDFVSLPYYTGLTSHLPSGLLASFQPAAALRDVGLSGVFARLAVNKAAVLSPPTLTALWTGYLCATFGLMAYSVARIRQAFGAGKNTANQ